ncbi:ligand-binding sensor domain-containing protein [Geofilum sp. OHC36d9]|uniref:ligand-binding sensor domain-containing protein n=1 Tax=Geofilum sp. OHC36d9 TaxID=3458413 RepID=UPI0040342341
MGYCLKQMLCRVMAVYLSLVIAPGIMAESTSMVFSHISVDDGLSNNFVKTIFKDSYGFLWFGTLEGINRFDGVEVRSYNHYFPDNIYSVVSISEDIDHKLWIGTESGLFYWDRVTNYFVEFDNELIKKAKIDKLLWLSQNKLLCSTEKGFFLINIHSFEIDQIRFHKSVDALLNKVTDFVVEDDQLFVATKGGLIQYDLKYQSSMIYNMSSLRGEEYLDFSCITKFDDIIYLGTPTKGIVGFNTHTKEYFEFNNFKDDIILSLAHDSSKLFIGTDSNGLLIYDVLEKRIARVEHVDNDVTSISSDAIYSLLIDDNSTLWVGTYAGGVNFASLLDKTFNTYSLDNESYNLSKSIRSIYFKNNTKYIGTRDGLYVIVDNKNVSYFSNDNSLMKSKIVLSFYDSQDGILFGTYGGGIYKYKINENSITAWNDNRFLNKSVYAFEEDSSGTLWIGTLCGLYKKEIAQSSSIRKLNLDADTLIYCLKVDHLNRLWIGSMSGARVYQINSDGLGLISDLPSVSGFKITGFYLDRKNTMWILSEKHGAFRVDMNLKVINHITEDDGLSNNSVCSMIEIESGEYWIGTLKGMSLYKINDHSMINFYKSNGLPGLVFNPNAIIQKDNQIWIGNEKGLVYFNPQKVVRDSGISNIVITDIYIGGKPIAEKEVVLNKSIEALTDLELRGKDNNIGFRFVNLSIPNLKESKYAVRLEKNGLGDDNNQWVYLDNENKVFYNSMKPGTYLFSIVLVDGAGTVIEDSLKSISIKITSEWYQSVFVLILIIIFLILLWLVFIYSIKNVRAKLKEAYIQINDDDKNRYGNSRLSVEESKELLTSIQNYVFESKIYLKPDLKIGDLAIKMDYSIHNISQSINQNLNQGFTDFINFYRVEEVKRRLEDPKYEKFTLYAVAEKCGFNSKSSFYRAFKRVTNQTPSDYWNDIHKGR